MRGVGVKLVVGSEIWKLLRQRMLTQVRRN